MMGWAALKTMISGRGLPDLFGEWVPIWMAYAVVYVFLSQNVGSYIIGMMDTISSKIAGASGATVDTSTATGAIRGGIISAWTSIQLIAEMPSSELWEHMGFFEKWTVGLLLIPLDFLVVWILKILTMLVIVIGAMFYVANAIMAQVSVALAIALAPVMVPFIIFGPMTWIFDSWLRFLLNACMLKIVGGFMLAISNTILLRMTDVAIAINQDTALAGKAASTRDMIINDLMLYASLSLMALVAGLLMHQVPGIATGLIGGGGGTGFKGVSAVTKSSGAAAAGSGARGSKQAVGVGAKWVGNKLGITEGSKAKPKSP
jgi:type IV secretory pathway VirB6-like protein